MSGAILRIVAFAVLIGALTAILIPAPVRAQATVYTYGTRYDLMQRVVGTIMPDPDGSGPLHFRATRNSYDAVGRLVKVETGELASWQDETIAPSSWSGFTVLQTLDTSYDADSRKSQDRLSSGGTTYSVTQYGYDAADRLVCQAVRMDPGQWNGQTDACTPQLTGSQGADRVTRTLYDGVGHVVQIRKAVGTSLEQAYATYAYTKDGKQSDVVDAVGNHAHFVYDGFDRQTQWQFPSTALVSGFNGSTPAQAIATAGAADTGNYEAYGYDTNGNRTSLRKRDGTTLTYQYDKLDRVGTKTVPASVTGAAAYSVYYGYDLQGHQLYARFGSSTGAGVTTSFDATGAVATASINLGGVTRTLGYQYNADQDRTQITHPDGQAFAFGYDNLDRMVWGHQPNGQQNFALSFDSAGNRNARDSSGTTTWGHDGIGRLTSLAETSPGQQNWAYQASYGYNPGGQITSESRNSSAYAFSGSVNVNRAYARNGLDQYTSAGPAAFTYDANGNLTSDGATRYVYDGENRLVSTSAGATLGYDPLGRLWQTTGSSGTTQFLYDGDRLTAEYTSVGDILRRYVHGPDADEPMVWYEGKTTDYAAARFLKSDHEGSIVAAVDINGVALAIDSYDEYGIPGIANLGRFQYTGQAWIPELRMYYYKARIYSPTLGRFLQTDPIGYEDQVNLYAYVGDDPLNRGDPSGDQSVGPPEAESEPGEEPGETDSSRGLSAWDLTVSGVRTTIQKVRDYFSGDSEHAGYEDPSSTRQSSIKPGGTFSRSQKAAYLEQNRARNNGVLRSDKSGNPLEPSQKSQRGVPTPSNAAQVDHYDPKAQGGANSGRNARILSADENRQKSDTPTAPPPPPPPPLLPK